MKKYTKIVTLILGSILSSSTALFSLSEAEKQRRELAQAVAFAFGSGKNILWKNEKNPAQRDMLYEPLLLCQPLSHKEQSVSLFFTRAGSLRYSLGDMIDLNVVKDIARNALEMKLALEADPDDEPNPADYDNQEEDPDYQDALQAYLDEQAAGATNTANQIIECAKQISFQEHKLGAALYKKWHLNDSFFISARTWAGLAERNYWLDSQYRDRITQLMKQIFPNNDGSFTMSDYVTMNWGIGDTHVKTGWTSHVGTIGKLSAGLKAILPTASESRRNTAHQLIPLRLDDFGGYARTRLNEVLIAPKLGNGGHYGAGAWTEALWRKSFFDNKHTFKLKMYAGADFLCESAEERLLMRYVDDNATKARGTFRTTNDHLFRAFIGQFILPEPVEVMVAPGAIVTMGVSARYRANHIDFIGGYDWYYKGKEVIGRCIDREDVAAYVPSQEAVVSKSIEHKVFGGISYNTQCENVSLAGFVFPKLSLSFGLNGAAALSATGMGKDFGVGLSFGCKC